MDRKEKVIKWLDNENINYGYFEHVPVYTMEDVAKIDISDRVDVCKNLFLRDHGGKVHYLVVVYGDKRVDLRALSEQVGSRLSFDSDKRLKKYLNMETGEVSPMGLVHDEDHVVRVLFDGELRDKQKLGFHPCDRASTVVLAFEDLEKLVGKLGNQMHFISV